MFLPKLAVVLAIASGLSGCVAEVAPAPYVGGSATVYAATVPADIELYPHVWYDGGYAYLVGDHWYHSGPRGWVVLQTEPAPLYRYHSTWGYGRPVQPAPGAVERQAAPPAHYYPYYPPPPPAPPRPPYER